MPDVSYFAAFGAGIFSFISPCVLPLVPGYISFISGVSFDQMQSPTAADAARTRRQMLITSLAFILGLALVFIAFGAGATVLGQTLRSYKNVLEKISGVLLVIFGLHLAGVFRIKFLDQDTRIQTSKQPAGPLGAVLVGMAFAFGWSPCIGPILGGILAIAGSRESVGEGVSLLAVYSAGLGVPFLITTLAIDKFFIASKRIRRHYKKIEIAAGALLIFLGVLIFTGQFTQITRYIDKMFPWLTNLS